MYTHDNGDELFYVVKGKMEMQFKDRIVHVKEGELILVPKEVEYCPRTMPDEECHLVHGDTTVLFYNFFSTRLNPDGSIKTHTPWNCTEVFARINSK